MSMLTVAKAQTFPEGLYVHVPFCASLCRYCDFASEIHTAARAERYLGALETELSVRVADLLPDERFAPRTIYVGGGTPTALSIAELTRFFDILRKHVDASRVVEFTIEANPGSTDEAKLELLRRRGVNRISLGVQSFQPRFLSLLGRVHSAEQGREAVPLARAAGFDNISVDLIHGLPGQSPDDLRRDLDAVAALQTEHVSAYGLAYEEGTPLHAAVQRGEIAPLTPEQEAAHYMTVMETLEQAGLLQYEISNYARPGRECRHNMMYWRNEAYLGVGASAASFIQWQRSTNHEDVDAYVEAVEATGKASATSEVLTPEARAREALVLELRLRRGVELAEFKNRWGLDFAAACSPAHGFLREGLMERTEDGRYRISRRGLPVADGILAEFV
ncbi:MAG: radical SAM family heme chaperone HemW [Planctomycetota bacterium]|nr:radical SAM family heme chaperone HemW [Planctomycetota bacterium]